MKIADFDYELPEHLIAKTPLPERDGARMLYFPAKGGWEDRMVRDLPDLVRPGDVWVLNDTRVIPARLFARRKTGGRVEILLLEKASGQWKAWIRGGGRLRVGERLQVAEDCFLRLVGRSGKEFVLKFLNEDEESAIAAYGQMPIPPYIGRQADDSDRHRYQTVYARCPGAVAAPTAGLHLSKALLHRIEEAGGRLATVTLHVGPGTFQLIECENVEEHVMHKEVYHIPEETAAAVNAAIASGGRIVAVGTTSLRALESAWLNGRLKAGSGKTGLFIYPGYRFKVVHALLTNFHLPRSSLLMLVCAIAGRRRVLDAYAYAMRKGYRFYSYGDATFFEMCPKNRHSGG